GSMIIFAATQTVMVGLIQPIVDDVLSPPGRQEVARPHPSREEAVKERVLNSVLHRDRPAGQRGWIVNGADKALDTIDVWWNGDPAAKPRRILFALLVVFVIRAFTSFFSEYAFQKVGLATVKDLRDQLYE